MGLNVWLGMFMGACLCGWYTTLLCVCVAKSPCLLGLVQLVEELSTLDVTWFVVRCNVVGVRQLYEGGVFNGCNQTDPDIDHNVQLVGAVWAPEPLREYKPLVGHNVVSLCRWV